MTTNAKNNGHTKSKPQSQVKAKALHFNSNIEVGDSKKDMRFHTEVKSALLGLLNNEAPRRKDGGVIVGIASADGSFISSSNYAKGLTVTKKGYDPDFSMILSGNKPAEGQHASPKAIQEGDDQYNKTWAGVIQPPWAFDLLQSMYISNEMHGACIDAKATDVNFSGYELKLVPEIESGQIKVDVKVLETAKREVEQFLSQCVIHPQIPLQMPFTALTKEAYTDYETMGMMEFEVLRNSKGMIGALSQIPAQTVYVLGNEESKRRLGCRYIQRRFSGQRYFLPFMGAVEIVKDGFDPLTSPVEDFPAYEKRSEYIRLRDNLPDANLGDEEAESANEAATELFVLPRTPFTRSTVYGTPSAVAAYPAILGLAFIDEYNKNFFTSKGIPQYAVIIEGLAAPATIVNPDSEEEIEDPTAALESTIREFFQNNLRKADRSVLIMSTFGETKVRFEKLSAEETDGSFGDLEVRYNERLRLAHHVPPAALGVSEITRSGSGKTNSGNGRELSQMMRYRSHIVAPEQQVVQSVLRAVIRGGLLIPYYDVHFNSLDIDEEVMQREFLLNELKEGAISANEYRKESARYSRSVRIPIGKPDDIENPANGLILRTAQVTVFGAKGIVTTAPGDSASQDGTKKPVENPPKEDTKEKPVVDNQK